MGCRQLDTQSTRQQELLYNAEFQIQQMERKVGAWASEQGQRCHTPYGGDGTQQDHDDDDDDRRPALLGLAAPMPDPCLVSFVLLTAGGPRAGRAQ